MSKADDLGLLYSRDIFGHLFSLLNPMQENKKTRKQKDQTHIIPAKSTNAKDLLTVMIYEPIRENAVSSLFNTAPLFSPFS